ncbi:hypothetical protein [Pendulispora albinea]|uniref:Uncharacterized protein n=1 Tax=Pendulispora albinea TaxID=2741071 RepID=A0ABZ2M2T4_9BACT
MKTRAVLASAAVAALAALSFAASLSFAGAPRSASPIAPPPTPVSDGDAAYGAAERLVNAGLAARRWTEKDARELRRLLPQMSRPQCERILHTLLPAINRGDIEVTATGRPF